MDRPAAKIYSEWLSAADAARYLLVSRSTLYRWLADGIVTRHLVAGRPLFARTDLDRLRAEARLRGVSLVYQLAQEHHQRTGQSDGRRR
jgi:excisionase family DNA binding protein